MHTHTPLYTHAASFVYPNEVRDTHPSCCSRYLTLAQAQAKALQVDWADPINKPVTPKVLGTKAFNAYPIEDVVDYIDWNPFFQVGWGFCRGCIAGHMQVGQITSGLGHRWPRMRGDQLDKSLGVAPPRDCTPRSV